MPRLLHHLDGVCPRLWQLRLRPLRQLQRQLSAPHHRLLRVHRRLLRLRHKEVRTHFNISNPNTRTVYFLYTYTRVQGKRATSCEAWTRYYNNCG